MHSLFVKGENISSNATYFSHDKHCEKHEGSEILDCLQAFLNASTTHAEISQAGSLSW